MIHDRSLPAQSPGPFDQRLAQNAAFVDENEVGTLSFRFFLIRWRMAIVHKPDCLTSSIFQRLG